MCSFTRTLTAGVLLIMLTPAFAGDDKFAPVKGLIETCETCHGKNGASTIPLNPVLAGQEFYYLYVQLKDFKAKRRDNAIMSVQVADMEKDSMKLLAEYFSKQSWPKNDHEVTPEQRTMAKQVINSGQCVACHLGAFRGNSRIPRLANQHAQYLEKTMLDFHTKNRQNAPSMNSLMETFSEEEISAVASYLSGFDEEKD